MLKPFPMISMSVMKQLSMALTCVLVTLSVRTQRAPMSVCVHFHIKLSTTHVVNIACMHEDKPYCQKGILLYGF